MAPFKLNDDLSGRLYNYKFNSALKYLDGEPEEVKLIVNTLARMFGNVGWGLEGDIGILVAFVLDGLGVKD